MSDDENNYEDDFDERLLTEFEPRHDLAEEADDAVEKLESEIVKQLDLTIRPTTSGGLRASVDLAGLRAPVRPATSGDSSRSLRQSLDLFAALDLANTNSALKDQYSQYWDAVEKQVEVEEQMKAKKEERVDQKHLARLNAKIASKHQKAMAHHEKESGWDAGFPFERESPVVHARSPKARAFDRPSVVKASNALAQYIAAQSSPQAQSAATTGSGFASSLVKPASSKASTTNAKPLPPQPGVVDPARVRKVVQTRMPAIVLAKLAASRRARAQSAKPKRKTFSAKSIRRVSMDEADEVAEEISPPNSKSRLASQRSLFSVASATSFTPGALSATAGPSAMAIKRRAASAGMVKPTNASALLAAERAAQAAAAAVPADSKIIPITQWNRMKRELEDLRRKVVALESENEILRVQQQSQQPVSSASPPTAGPKLHSRASSAAITRPAPTRALSSTTTVSVTSTAVATVLKQAARTPTAKQSSNPGLKLNLAGLIPDGGSPPPAAIAALTPSAAAAVNNLLLSPKGRCAVNGCGAVRVSGKPYCSTHLVTTPTAASTIASPQSQLPSTASRERPTSAAVAPPTASGFGMHGLQLNLGGAPKQFEYDYASDDNYGGTDEDDDGSSASVESSFDASHISFSDSLSSSQIRTVQHQVPAFKMQMGAPTNDGLTARGGSTGRANDGLTARGSSDGFTARASDGLTGRQETDAVRGNPVLTSARSIQPVSSNPASSSAAPNVVRVKSDPSVAPIYSSRAAPNIPRPGALTASATPRIPTSTTITTTTTMTRGVEVNTSSGGLGFDLEALRHSPYAGIDGLNGSFEITQSGTFKRGGFALNKQGMTTPGSAGSGGSGEERATFQWDALPTTSRGSSISSTSASPAHRSTAASSPSSHRSSPGSSAASTPSSASAVRSLNVADIYTLGVLGRGSSGVVYRAFHAPSMELLAVKEIGIHEKDKRKQLTQELRTLTQSSNPQTIGFRGAYFDDQHIYIALEYMDRGSLDDLLQQHGPLSEIELAFIFEQVLMGLRHLEKIGVIHRDIKPHNILYNQRGQFKLTDFGIISDIKDRNEQQAIAEAKTFVGTLLYMSPERIGGQSYSYSCDIWSTALSLLTCRVGEFAIPHGSHWELVNSIQRGPAILNSYSSEQVSDLLRDLLDHCLRANPADRPTASECLQHPFFSQFRIAGSTRPIPCPPGFPPTSIKVNPWQSPSPRALSMLSEKEQKRLKKEEEVARKNERHAVEQICSLCVSRGLTSKRATAIGPTGSPQPLPLPIDPDLCDRMVARLVTLLNAPADLVRSILIAAHNKLVGIPTQ